MKKLLLVPFLLIFSVAHAEIFMLSDQSDILYDNSYPLNEYLISDAQNKCVFHYLSAEKIQNGYTAEIINESYPDACLEKGWANVNIFNPQKQLVESLNGYFTDGFFVGYLPLNASVIKRFSDPDSTQHLYFLLDEDAQMQIRYLGLMKSTLQESGKYSAFEGCHTFEIMLQTSNKALFENPETLKNLTGVAKNYAHTLCPAIREIIMYASDSPSLNPDSIYFIQRLYLSNNGIWVTDTIQNISSKQQTQAQEEPVAVKEQEPAPPAPISSAPPKKQRITQHKKQEGGKSPEQLLEISAKSGMPVLAQLVVHISKRTNRNVVFIDTPIIMKAFGNDLNLKPGWYHMKAALTPMSDFEKKRSGISLNATAAQISIQEATPCKQDLCLDLRK